MTNLSSSVYSHVWWLFSRLVTILKLCIYVCYVFLYFTPPNPFSLNFSIVTFPSAAVTHSSCFSISVSPSLSIHFFSSLFMLHLCLSVSLCLSLSVSLSLSLSLSLFVYTYIHTHTFIHTYIPLPSLLSVFEIELLFFLNEGFFKTWIMFQIYVH